MSRPPAVPPPPEGMTPEELGRRLLALPPQPKTKDESEKEPESGDTTEGG